MRGVCLAYIQGVQKGRSRRSVPHNVFQIVLLLIDAFVSAQTSLLMDRLWSGVRISGSFRIFVW